MHQLVRSENVTHCAVISSKSNLVSRLLFCKTIISGRHERLFTEYERLQVEKSSSSGDNFHIFFIIRFVQQNGFRLLSTAKDNVLSQAPTAFQSSCPPASKRSMLMPPLPEALPFFIWKAAFHASLISTWKTWHLMVWIAGAEMSTRDANRVDVTICVEFCYIFFPYLFGSWSDAHPHCSVPPLQGAQQQLSPEFL